MGVLELVLAAAAGAVCLAIAAVIWAMANRRLSDARTAALQTRLALLETEAAAAKSSVDVFDSAVLAADADTPARLIAGEDTLAACARALGCAEEPAAVLACLGGQDGRLKALLDRGAPCAFQIRGPLGTVEVEGRAAGSVCLVKLRISTSAEPGLPGAPRLAESSRDLLRRGKLPAE